MPRISLRAYEKQIEELIEQNRLQEAVDHCRYILMTYPKCISAYRILGKALLEGKQYNEAGDIFKRVLAVYPDDFIAHVGMSIIRENENNLDAAIWHMELAFDSQPSNITIQEELKRLFGRRDGTHPAKIRLTRGALVRMYARGELYPQAVAEIKSALAEDPKRLDLKVMLTNMYFLLGDSTEALALSNELIVELPYCYEINKILVAILPTTNKSEKTPMYQDRIRALDPYEEFVNEINLSAADVPDDQVMIDQMDEIQTSVNNENPNWVQSIESKWEEPSNLNALEWLPQANNESGVPNSGNESLIETQSLQTAKQPQSVELPIEKTPVQEPADDQLPDWMRSAGWLPSDEPSSTNETAPETLASDEPASAEPTGDLPEWLRSLASADSQPQSSEAEPTPEPIDQPSPATAFSSPTVQENSEPISNNAENNSENDLPDWLKNFEVEGATESEAKDDLPEWMKNIQPLEQPTNSASENSAATSDLFIDSTPDTTPEPSAPASVAETDAFINNTQTTRTLDPEQAGIAPVENTLPPTAAPLPNDWKSNLVEETPIAEETTDTSDSGLPDWVRSVMDKMPQKDEQANESVQPIEPVSEIVEPDATATNETFNEINAEADTTSPALNEKSGDDLLSWLRDLKPEENNVANDESEASDSTGDLPAFEDNSPLDRLQQLTENETTVTPVEQSENILPSNTETFAESVMSENDETIDQTIENPVEEESPSSLLDRLTHTTVLEDQPTELTADEEMSISPIAADTTDSFTDQLDQLSKQIMAGNTIDSVIKKLTELSVKHTDNYLVWQLLGDAYAKIDNFSNALHAYNKAEELILKPQ